MSAQPIVLKSSHPRISARRNPNRVRQRAAKARATKMLFDFLLKASVDEKYQLILTLPEWEQRAILAELEELP